MKIDFLCFIIACLICSLAQKNNESLSGSEKKS